MREAPPPVSVARLPCGGSPAEGPWLCVARVSPGLPFRSVTRVVGREAGEVDAQSARSLPGRGLRPEPAAARCGGRRAGHRGHPACTPGPGERGRCRPDDGDCRGDRPGETAGSAGGRRVLQGASCGRCLGLFSRWVATSPQTTATTRTRTTATSTRHRLGGPYRALAAVAGSSSPPRGAASRERASRRSVRLGRAVGVSRAGRGGGEPRAAAGRTRTSTRRCSVRPGRVGAPTVGTRRDRPRLPARPSSWAFPRRSNLRGRIACKPAGQPLPRAWRNWETRRV